MAWFILDIPGRHTEGDLEAALYGGNWGFLAAQRTSVHPPGAGIPGHAGECAPHAQARADEVGNWLAGHGPMEDPALGDDDVGQPGTAGHIELHSLSPKSIPGGGDVHSSHLLYAEFGGLGQR